ncbi:hypothetical protein SpCBS45565_g07975 [Spizellomyces sp. 'palustris']|nr:hypothetical protein SpCBS45565_g07975 [Spizellomyces sp. 'palustris']
MTIPPVTSQALQRPSGGSQLVSAFPSRFIYLRLLAIVLWLRTVWVAFWGRKKHVDQDIELSGKCPRHLAVVFRPLQHSLSSAYDEDGRFGHQNWMNAVGNIVEWCISDGVACLTVFDEKGLLKSHAARLAQIVDKLDLCRESADPPVQVKASIQLLVSGSPVDRTQRERTILDEGIDLDPHGVRRPTNEPSTSSNKSSESDRHVDLWVNLISASDGRNSLVRVARTLGRQALAASHADNRAHLTTNVDLVDKLIKADSPDLNQFPEPELIYVVGCQSNFLEIGNLCPWNIRLSEFWFVDNIRIPRIVLSPDSLSDAVRCKVNCHLWGIEEA